MDLTLDAGIDRIRAEQARTMYRQCPVGVISAATGAILLAVAFAATERTSRFDALLWSGLMLGCVTAHLMLCLAFWRAAPPEPRWRPWLWSFTVIAFVEGLTWLLGAVLMSAPGDLTQELMVLLVSSAISSGAVPVFGTYLPTYVAFFFPAMLPHLWFGLTGSFPLHGLLAALVVAYLVAMSLIALRSNRQLIEGLTLRFENLDLVAGLREQKAIAEVANLAKSTFLAAASHDLRQPIHALGLFIGALRGRRMDGPARDLVEQIGQSVGAMDDLFAALLDISKLDAGVVEVRPEPVALAPLLRRLGRDYAVEAAAKGVALIVAESSAAVVGDPALIERIVRNLLANAVRYTVQGSILVGCRRAGGDVRIEVWDTGCGIAADDYTRIFDEFVQVGNPERDRSKGLGLGLAIVRRLAMLIGASLSFDSQMGRGSVFRLTLPRHHGPVLATPLVFTPLPATTGHIVVIDDEAPIRAAMTALLTGWGYAVHAVGALSELDYAVPAPALIISDYRLRDGATGDAAIAALRQHYRTAIPALLITGDTAPDRIAEAQASGIALLHKPLANAKLRAAIGNLLRATSP